MFERKFFVAEIKSWRELDSGVEVYKIVEGFLEFKKRLLEDESENKVELRKKGGFEGGGFFGRKKVFYLALLSSIFDGGIDSFGIVFSSFTKTIFFFRYKKNDFLG